MLHNESTNKHLDAEFPSRGSFQTESVFCVCKALERNPQACGDCEHFDTRKSEILKVRFLSDLTMNAKISNDTTMSDDEEGKLWELAETKRTEGLRAFTEDRAHRLAPYVLLDEAYLACYPNNNSADGTDP